MKFSSATGAPRAPAPGPDHTLEMPRQGGGQAFSQSREPGPVSGAACLQPAVIQFGRFGDMVMLSSVLPLLHHRFGGRCLLLGAGPWNVPLYGDHPDVARVWSVARHVSMALGLTGWRALWALRRSAPGPIYVCERQPRQVQRIRRLLGFGGIDPARCLYITDQDARAGEHWVDRLVRFVNLTPPVLRAADYPVPEEANAPAPRLLVSEAERAELRTWLNAQGWAGRKLILIQPGNFRSMSRSRERWQRTHADDKAWQLENWVALLCQVHARMPQALIVLCGAPQEGAMLEQIRIAAAVEDVVVAELPMRRLLALSELADSMISIDTGPAHAAAALGLPLIVLYGAESPSHWLPRSPCGSPVIGLGGPPRSSRVDQIPVAEVFEHWCALNRQPRSGAAPRRAPS